MMTVHGSDIAVDALGEVEALRVGNRVKLFTEHLLW